MKSFKLSLSPEEQSLLISREALKKVLKYQHVGFHDLPHRQSLWEAVEAVAQRWKGKFDKIAVIGIGGSSLGPQVIAQCLHLENIHFLENVDGLNLQHQLKSLNQPERVVWIFSSKSGSTIETLATIDALENHYQSLNQKLGPMGAVISEKKDNPLTRWGQKKGFEFLEIPLDVGGRFSVLTAVGLLPAALAGVKIQDLQRGALAALENPQWIENAVAVQLKSFKENRNISVFWFYCASGVALGRWVQQLWAESIGKKTTRQGLPAPLTSTPVLAMGSVDQHSTLQQMMEGQQDKVFWFFKFSDVEAAWPVKASTFDELGVLKNKSLGELIKAQSLATQKALAETGAPTMQVQYDDLSAETLGHFFMSLELVVATLAEALDLNAFDQPGVERGKILALELLRSPM
ncbi:MAG: glucose-6-phosphate isomerase [Bdellovibrionales bacterium]